MWIFHTVGTKCRLPTGYKLQTTVQVRNVDYRVQSIYQTQSEKKTLFSSCQFITYPVSRSHFSEVFVYKISPVSEVCASAVHRKKKDGGCTFYLDTLRTKLSPLRHTERYGLMAVVPTLTALLLLRLFSWCSLMGEKRPLP